MGVWVAWLIGAAVLGAGEMHTGGFFLAPFSLGALAAAALGLAGVGILGMIVAFFGVSALTLLLLRPIASRHRRLPPAVRTGAKALIGKRALVVERIANDEGVGAVKIDGEVWSARSFDEETIEPGEQVEVVEIKGATAMVMH